MYEGAEKKRASARDVGLSKSEQLELGKISAFHATLPVTEDLGLGFEIFINIFHILVDPRKNGEIKPGITEGEGNLRGKREQK